MSRKMIIQHEICQIISIIKIILKLLVQIYQGKQIQLLELEENYGATKKQRTILSFALNSLNVLE